MAAETIRIGSWQGPIVEGDFDRNLQKVRAVLDETRDWGLDFLCFPEAYLSGYSPQAIRESAVSLSDPRLVRFIADSKQYETVILVGTAERKGESLFNSQLVIYGGALLGVCHKVMLTRYDAGFFSPSLALPVFEAKGIRFGVAICHDTSFVEPALYLRWKGARLLFTPHYNDIGPQGSAVPGEPVNFWGHRTMVLNNQAALATLLKMVVVRSNVVIIREDALGSGDSNIWDMDGVMVAEGVPFTECVVTAEFDKQIFLQEHWISRQEVPVELVERIAQAAQDYSKTSAPARAPQTRT